MAGKVRAIPSGNRKVTPMPHMLRIDNDVHAVIERSRVLSGDDGNAVLRRLLEIDPPLQGWHSDGVFLPNGTKIRMGYSEEKRLNGEVIGGRWVIGRKKFDSPSRAAGEFIRTRKGKRVAVNGWLYWHVLPPGRRDWALLDSLRPDAQDNPAPGERGLRSVGNGKAAA